MGLSADIIFPPNGNDDIEKSKDKKILIDNYMLMFYFFYFKNRSLFKNSDSEKIKIKITRLFQFIIIIPSLLFAFDPGPRFDNDLTFDCQYNLVTNLKIQELYGTIHRHNFSYSLAYKFDNDFVFGFSFLAATFGVKGSDIKGDWVFALPPIDYSLYAMYEFYNQKNPFFTFAAGAKAGYWMDDYVSPLKHLYDNSYVPRTEFITEYFGGPVIGLSYGFRRFSVVAKGGINFGTKTRRTSEYDYSECEPAKFAVAPEISIGLRLSTYTSKDSSGRSESIDLRPQAVYVEILGLSFNNIFSLNYEHIVADHLALRTGFSFWMYDSPQFRFPVSATYLVGKEHLRLEFGAGTALNFPKTEREKHIVREFFPICGIRHQGEKTGIIWRLSYTPFFVIDYLHAKNDMYQWPSFSIGYSFPRR